MTSFRNNFLSKKAFSLIELMISIILISLMFGLYFYENDNSNNINHQSISLSTLKSDLIRDYSFNESLRLVCITTDMNCYVLIDNIFKKNRPIKKIFDELPEVYEYSLEFKSMSLNEIVFENEEVEEVFFDFYINKDLKINEMIVFYKDEYYIYNAFSLFTIILKDKEKIINMFEDRLLKVKDAFSI